MSTSTAPAAPAYYYLDGDTSEPVGPLRIAAMQHLVAKGTVRSGMLVAREGAAEWSPVESFSELAVALPKQPAPTTIFFKVAPPKVAAAPVRVPPTKKEGWSTAEWIVVGVFGALAIGFIVPAVKTWLDYERTNGRPARAAAEAAVNAQRQVLAREEQWFGIGYAAGEKLGQMDGRKAFVLVPTDETLRGAASQLSAQFQIPPSDRSQFEAGVRSGYEAGFKAARKPAF